MRIRTRTRANCLLRNDRPTRRRLSAYDNRTDYNTGAVSYRFTISKLTLTDVFSRTPNRLAFVRHRIMSDRHLHTDDWEEGGSPGFCANLKRFIFIFTQT